MGPSGWEIAFENHFHEYVPQQVAYNQLHISFWHLQLLICSQCLPCSDTLDKPVFNMIEDTFLWNL